MLFLLLAMLASEPDLDELCAKYASRDVAVAEDEDARELAEQYANERDFAAAIRVLCIDEAMAEAEKSGMLEHILQMQNGETDAPLDFCEHATSRDGMILCAARIEESETPKLRARYDAIRKKHGPPLDALRERADAFIKADAFWESELSREGTMYAYAETEARLDRERAFIELLEQHSRERATSASNADFKRADDALNAAYRKRMNTIDPELSEDINNLRDAQRAWIAYRDAWIAWYQQRWRGTASPDALRREIATTLTRARVEELGRI